MTGDQLYNAIEHIASYSVLLPIAISLIRIKALNITLWALLIYLILCLVVDQSYLSLLPDQQGANVLANCWALVECLIFCFIYYSEAKTIFFKRFIATLFIGFIGLSLFSFWPNIAADNKVVSPVEAGLIILIAVCMFIQMIFDGQTGRLIKNYFFWINFALLMYFCAAILIFIENDYLYYLSEYEPEKGRQIWSMHEMIGIFCNILISVGIWLSKRMRIQL